MPIYEEKVKDKKTGKMIVKKVGKDKQKQYYIRTYTTDENGNRKQVTKHNKNWVGKDGYWKAHDEENRIRNNSDDYIKKKKIEKLTLHQLKEKYLEHIKGSVDDETLRAKANKLSHFCDLDKTHQVKTYPNKYINSFTKEMYDEWKKEIKNKKYTRAVIDKAFYNEWKKEESKRKYVWYSLSIQHLNSIHNEICSMIDYGIEEGFFTGNFAKQSGKIGTAKEIKMSNDKVIYEVIDYDEYLRLLKVSKDNLKYNTYFNLEFKRGLRTGEIRALRICDYNSDKKQLMINHTMSRDNKLKLPKTKASKAPIDLDEELNNKISALIAEYKKKSACNDNWYIFNGPTPISSNALENSRDKYFKLAGINKHIRLHDLRHSCATWLFSIGIPITVISKILRHANIQETMKTYTHLLNKDYEEAMDKINNL